MSWIPRATLEDMGFSRLGNNVLISDRASIYNYAGIEIGSDVRIDDFSVLSAGNDGICLGNYIHIAVHCSVIGAARITLSDYCNLSSRVSIYSSNDDYSGGAMTNPMVPAQFTNVSHKAVFLDRHVIIGSGSIILPGVTLGEGVAVGALSLVTKDCEPFGVYAGNPATRVKSRKRDLLAIEKRLLEMQGRFSVAD